MSKSHAITIYLLKELFSPSQALRDENHLQRLTVNLPNSTLYLADIPPKAPWWKSYLEIDKDFCHGLKGAILFLEISKRTFAITFGNIQHKLKPESYEYDFGLITTLNSIDANSLRSTDILTPENAIRQRIQPPHLTELTFFDFDKDSSIIKRLTGKVKDCYKNLFTTTSGADSLRISTKTRLSDLPHLCNQLLKIYEREDYKQTFPGLNNIRPIKDPNKLDVLDKKLIAELKKKSNDISLSLPDILDYSNISKFIFSPSTTSSTFDSLEIDSFYLYLGIQLADLTIEKIKKTHHIIGVDDSDNQVTTMFPIYRSLIWDFTENNESYHFCDGKWYQVEKALLSSLRNYLDEFFKESHLPNYQHNSEGEYNLSVAQKLTNYICLDKKNIAPASETAVEPCDLFNIEENSIPCFTHVKLGTRSSMLSHLFNQGIASISLINSNSESLQKFKNLIKSHRLASNYIETIESPKKKVVYAIVSHKNADLKSNILPLFSRITLRNTIQDLRRMNVQCAVTIIKDIRSAR